MVSRKTKKKTLKEEVFCFYGIQITLKKYYKRNRKKYFLNYLSFLLSSKNYLKSY